LNAYIAANLMFLSAQRPAAIRNVTIDEYNNKEENEEAEGCHLIKVVWHKTEALGPARVFASKDITTLMNIYLRDVRTVIKPQSSELQSRFFLTPTGNEVKNLSEAINKVAQTFGIETPNATVHRKVVSTETKRHKKECIPEVCEQMSQSRETCERFYSRTSNEQSFEVQSTIQQLCSNRYFTSEQSDLLTLEWPLDKQTIPLSLCRALLKKYKHLCQKTHKQLQDHWKCLRKQ